MSNNIHNNNSNLLNISYDEWNTYLQYNKQIIINKIDNTLLIDSTKRAEAAFRIWRSTTSPASLDCWDRSERLRPS